MMGSSIRVTARVRPFVPTDHPNDRVVVETIPCTNQVFIKDRECFAVDTVLPTGCSQSQLFNLTVNPLIEYFMEGYDISVIAYGQSRSGKTYAIIGPGLHCAYSETEYGIIPRATREIFNQMFQRPERRYRLRVAYIDIRGEEITDLLSTSQYRRNVILGEDEHGKTVIVGAEEIECQTVSEVFSWLQTGLYSQYHTSRLYPNHSHTIFILTLEQLKSIDGAVYSISSKALFVDLGGSERTVLVNDGMHLVAEPVQVDSGLMALEKVVHTVTQAHSLITRIPYQLSVLTRILQNAIGGSALTSFICCLSPTSLDSDESFNTLRFAAQLRGIVNVPVMNVLSPPMMSQTTTNLATEEHYTEDIYDVEDSEERSTNDDTFGQQFATSLWHLLITGAEDLFSKLVDKESLSLDEKDKIERWLCMKHECEDCVNSDDATSVTSFKGFEGRVLERIDELTESEHKTDSPTASDSSESQSNLGIIKDYETHYESEFETDTGTESETASESETETETESLVPDFLDRLDELMGSFRRKTDRMVQEAAKVPTTKSCTETDTSGNAQLPLSDEGDEETSPSHTVPAFVNRRNFASRRRSIYPGSIKINMDTVVNQSNKDVSAQEERFQTPKITSLELSRVDKIVGTRENVCTQMDAVPLKDSLLGSSSFSTSPLPVAYKELKLLSAETEARQVQIKQVLIDLDGAHKRIEELQQTIQLKEQFINEMISNNDTRVSAKQRFLRKRSKLEEQYYRTRTHLAQAECALLQAAEGKNASEERHIYEKEILKYRNLATHYEKRLKDIQIVKKIAGDSAKKVLELEASLQTSKKQMEMLQKQLKKEEEHKRCLERELLHDQHKIKELEEQYKLQASKLKEKDTTEDERLKWIQEEEERLLNMRESSQRLQKQILLQQSILEKREAFLQEKLDEEKAVIKKSMMGMSAKASQIKNSIKEKSSELEITEDPDENLAVRQEIENLRKTRDLLLEQRAILDKKFQKEKVLTTEEERKYLEYDEAIEAIDAAIEYKNELICGRKGQGLESSSINLDKEEQLLLARLMKLSQMEMRAMLHKYFQKVVDLRENGQKMEAQIAELDQQTDVQSWKIRSLIHALQQAEIETERRLVLQQKQDEEKLHLMLKHFAEESSGGSSGAEVAKHYNAEKEVELTHYRRENRHLKKRLQELESALKADGKVHTRRKQSVSPVAIPKKNLRQLQGNGSAPTTKVTRQKNKLIIQQQKTKNSSKS